LEYASIKSVIPLIKRILISLIALLPLAATAGEGELRLQQFFAQTRTLKADFEQRLISEDGVLQQLSHGNFTLQRPGRFRWEYLDPYPQQIINDGERIWFFDSELEQATVKSIDTAFASTPTMVLTGDEPLERHFFIEEYAMEGDRRWVRLMPIREESEFKEIRLAMGREGLDVMEVLDGFGSTTRITFTTLIPNPELDPQLFVFIPGEGVDVIRDSDILN